jgi:hypothetical protein
MNQLSLIYLFKLSPVYACSRSQNVKVQRCIGSCLNACSSLDLDGGIQCKLGAEVDHLYIGAVILELRLCQVLVFILLIDYNPIFSDPSMGRECIDRFTKKKGY